MLIGADKSGLMLTNSISVSQICPKLDVSMKHSKTRSRTKQASTPGGRLLQKIRPYSTFMLSYNVTPFVNPTDASGKPLDWSDEKAVEDWYLNRNRRFGKLSDQIRSICSKPAFRFLKSERTINAPCEKAMILFGHPRVFDDVPTVATFEHDIKVFRKITLKYPGLIQQALEILSEKYSELHYLSDDYVEWRSWLADEKVGLPDTILDFTSSLTRKETQAISIHIATPYFAQFLQIIIYVLVDPGLLECVGLQARSHFNGSSVLSQMVASMRELKIMHYFMHFSLSL